MTTIATDGKTMAGDGQREMCRTIVDAEAAKIRRLSDGRVFGSCGDAPFGEEVVAWLEGGEKPSRKPEDGFAGLILSPSGEIFHVNESCFPIRVMTPMAVGSGMDFAIGAMEHGASPEEAVRIACKRDPGSGGEIIALAIEGLRVVRK